MSRPLLVVGFSFLAAQFSALFLDFKIQLILAAVLLLAAIISIVFNKVKSYHLRTLSAAFIAAFFALCIHIPYSQSLQSTASRFEGKTVHSVMQILDGPEYESGRVYYTVRQESIEGDSTAKPFKLRLSCISPLSAEIYDRIEGEICFSSFTAHSGISQQNRYFSRGIISRAYIVNISDYTVIKTPLDERPLYAVFKDFAFNLNTLIAQALPFDEASLVQAMLLGERSNLNESIISDFRIIGISHFLSLSGMHLSVIAGMLMYILRTFRVRGAIKCCIAIVCIAAFLAVTGFQSSALRSGIMLILFLIADAIGAEADSLNSLGAAVLFICLANPFSAADIGFLLSALATLGILTFSERISVFLLKPVEKHPRTRKALSPIAVSIAITLSALVFTLPLSIYIFGTISLITPLANLMLILPCTIFLYASFLLALTLCIPFLSALSPFFAFVAGLSARAVLIPAHFIAQLKFVYVYIGTTEGLLALSCILLMISITALWHRKSGIRISCIMCALIIICCACVQGIRYKDCVTIAVTASSDEFTCVVIDSDEAAVLAAGGYHKDTVLTILRRNNVNELSFMLINGESATQNAAAVAVLEQYAPEFCLVSSRIPFQKSLRRFPCEIVSDSREVMLTSNIGAEIAAAGKWITFTANGKTVKLESNISKIGEADVLITDVSGTKVISPFTVLPGYDIMSAQGASLPPGGHILPALENDGIIYIDIFPDGEIALRREDF